ncbi:MAG: hypothetical protein C4617_04785 [Candidatus Liberibacter europaeus]|uniref:Uncharacterized protein n=1 Tax=Candidatus Liberibacter europaeus TaxID=744859 RepID=A0A2T4VWP4_9HYPH|nr:MAG: hypothetical protein C4617_04785 [Candidatus Liberibacter europaeus]
MMTPTAGAILASYVTLMFISAVLVGCFMAISAAKYECSHTEEDKHNARAFAKRISILIQIFVMNVHLYWLFSSVFAFGLLAEWSAIPFIIMCSFGSIGWWKFKNKEQSE